MEADGTYGGGFGDGVANAAIVVILVASRDDEQAILDIEKWITNNCFYVLCDRIIYRYLLCFVLTAKSFYPMDQHLQGVNGF